LSVGACEGEQLVSFAALCRIPASGNTLQCKMDARDPSMVGGGAQRRLCAANTRVKWWGFFLLRRGRRDVWFLNDLADKHTIFSVLNIGPWRHLSLPVSPCYEILFSCLPEMPFGTGPGEGSVQGLHPGVPWGSANSPLCSDPGERGCLGTHI